MDLEIAIIYAFVAVLVLQVTHITTWKRRTEIRLQLLKVAFDFVVLRLNMPVPKDEHKKAEKPEYRCDA